MPKRYVSYGFTLLLLAAGGVLLSGCANYLRPFQVEPARPGLESQAYEALEDLPAPQERIVVGVYRFRDQTGQYKPSPTVSYSTAVTQGATSILIRALEQSGWFVPIEREGLSNLLNERQIIQSVRAQHVGAEGEQLGALPPLLYAGVLLEGGIIGYDSNVLTGGAGARYFGAGASGQFRQDRITIYLRAVSTQSGRVLKTVHTTKTILSQQVSANLFRFVAPERLLEAEAGYSFNEPSVLAVTEAIEAAVKALVVEGVRDDLWALADPAEASSPVFLAHAEAQETSAARDYYGRLTRPELRRGLSVAVAGGGQRYEGDYRNALVQPTGTASLRASLAPGLVVGLSASAGAAAADSVFATPHVAADAHVLYYATPRSRLSPFLMAGAGALLQEGSAAWGQGLFPYLTAGLGIEYMATSRMGLHLALSNTYPLLEGLDDLPSGGRVHDNLWSLTTGFTWYFPF